MGEHEYNVVGAQRTACYAKVALYIERTGNGTERHGNHSSLPLFHREALGWAAIPDWQHFNPAYVVSSLQSGAEAAILIGLADARVLASRLKGTH